MTIPSIKLSIQYHSSCSGVTAQSPLWSNVRRPAYTVMTIKADISNAVVMVGQLPYWSFWLDILEDYKSSDWNLQPGNDGPSTLYTTTPKPLPRLDR